MGQYEPRAGTGSKPAGICKARGNKLIKNASGSLALGALILAVVLMSAPRAEAVPKFRISTENSAEHVQTRAVAEFVGLLKERLGDKFDVAHYYGAELFRDRDVIKALDAGQVEMAAPGSWQLDRFEPNIGLFLLPAFYGAGPDVYHALLDGVVGQELVKRLEKRLDVKVIGRWLDLGHANLYGVKKKITRHDDIAGLRIRSPGGLANEARLKALGAFPITIPWPDLPEALSRGAADGLLTTHATIVSAALWNAGVKYAFEDHEYFPMYIPMVRGSFWRRLSPEQQQIIRDAWDSIVDKARLEAARAQDQAASVLTAHGVEITIPDPSEIKCWREKILPVQDDIVKSMGMDPELVERAIREISSF